MPSPKMSDVSVEPYNTALSLSSLSIESCVLIDNERLYDVCASGDNAASKPTLADLNKLVMPALSGATSTLRFPGDTNTDLKKLIANLTPMPRLSVHMLSHTPLGGPTSQVDASIATLSEQIFEP